MNTLSRALAITLMAAAVPATIAFAQQPEEGGPPPAQAEKYRGPSPETMQRLQDGRVAMAKEALKLTPEQEKLWAPVEEKIRARFEERQKKREEWRAKREERKADSADRKEKRAERLNTPLPERMEKRAERMTERADKMTERAAKMKEFASVLKPFYDSLSDEQKDVARVVLAKFASDGGHHGRGHHGHRWGGGKMCQKGSGHRGGGWH